MKDKERRNRHSYQMRFLAVLLAVVMLFTTSGFQTFAEQVGAESQTETSKKSEDKEKTASQSSETTEDDSLVLKTDKVSSQKAGGPAELEVEYSLGSNCKLGGVSTRLYVKNKNVQFPQFSGNTYHDPDSGRVFRIKKDEKGIKYISYKLKPGENFRQEFQFTDPTVKAGSSVSFYAVISAEGNTPANKNVQTTPARITYKAPAKKTQSLFQKIVNALTGKDNKEESTQTKTTQKVETNTEANVENKAGAEEDVAEASGNDEYGTYFTYVDKDVTVTATAEPEARLPKDAQLKADLVQPGSKKYENAVDLVDSQIATKKGYETDYVFYDVYFLVNGKRVEPEDGKVNVTMLFADPIFAEEKEVAEDYSVVHITEDKQVEIVTDDITVTEDGAVEALEFTTESFSLIGARMMTASVEDEKTSKYLANYMTNVIFKANSSDDSPVYDADNPAYDNGWFFLRLEFAEGNYQFPVYDANNAEATTLTYQIPEGIKGYDAVGPTNIVKTGTDEVYGTYEISSSGLISIKFNEKVQTYTNCSSFLVFQAQFDRDVIADIDEYTFAFEGTEGVTVKFNPGGNLSGRKTASEYNTETGTFTFTITIDAEENLTDVIIEDTMGANLILKEDSAKLDGKPVSITKTEEGFKAEFETLTKGTHQFTYQASIAADTLLQFNGTPIPGLENSATLDAYGETQVPVTGDAEHTHQWLEKSNSGVDEKTKKVTWNVTLYTDGLTNLTIKDKLPSSGLNYDRSTPISVFPAIDGKDTLNWNEVELGTDGKSWTYTLDVENPEKSYTFSYQTTVESTASGKLSNTVTVNNNFPTKSEVNLGDGIGTGTGTGIGTVEKNVGEVETEGDTKYVPWTSTIHLPAGKHTDVTYTDTLYGTHKFADDLSLNAENKYSKITVTCEGSNVNATLASNDDKTFVLDFGTLNLEKDTDIIISYYSVVVKNGSLSNVGDLNADGQATSDSEDTTVVDQNFSKTGVFDEKTGLITWRIYLNKKGNNLNGYMRVEDTFSENQELVPYEESQYWGAKALLYDDGEPKGAFPEVNGNKLILNFNPNTDKELYLEYQTKLKDGVSREESLTVDNEAKIFVNNKEVGNVDQDVVIPSNIFDKKLLEPNPSKENNYQAQFEIDVNESGIKLCPEGSEDDYVIEDKLSSAMKLSVSSLNVYQKAGNTWKPLSKEISESAYYTVELRDNNQTVIVTIKNAEADDNRTYKIEYAAQINPGSGMGTVDWDNQAAFRAGLTNKTASQEGTVKKEQSSDSGITGSRLYIKVHKYDAVTVNAIPNVTFHVYELNENEEKTGNPVATGFTDKDGDVILGQDPYADKATGYEFKENQRYVLEEETPQGYIANAPIYFQIGDKIKDSKYTKHKIGETFDIANMPAVSLTVTKKWDDNKDQDGVRPDSIKVQLYANDSPQGDPVTLQLSNKWTHTWENLPKKNNDGIIVYTVDELSVPDGYTKAVTEDNNSTASEINYTINNSYTPSTVEKTVQKEWDDNNNQDGIRPESVTLELQYKVDENDSYQPIDATFLTNYNKDNSKIQYSTNGTDYWTDCTSASVTLNGDASADSWSVHWRNLPEKINGQKVSYDVQETSTAEGYTVGDFMAGSDQKIINSHTPETICKTVRKYWSDTTNNDDGNRPSSVQVQLKQTYGPEGNKTTVNYDVVKLDQSNNWAHTWNSLPQYVRVGNTSYEATYTVEEISVPQYETTYYNAATAEETAVESSATTGAEVAIKNTYKPDKIKVEAQKVWRDNSNADNIRPKSITLTLQKKAEGDTQWTDVSNRTIQKDSSDTENNGAWKEKAVWTDLLKYENGKALQYRVVETNVPDRYTASYNVESFDATKVSGSSETIIVTNTHGAKATVNFGAKKVLTGNRKESLKAGEFTFYVKDSSGANVSQASNDVDGNVTFPTFEYTQKGTYNYIITESTGTNSFIQYSSEVYNVSVEVTMDNENGQLVATPTITKDGKTVEGFGKVVFTNTYKASGFGTVSGTKSLSGKPLTAGEFSFGLFESADAVTPIEGTVVTNTAPGTDGKGSFTIQTPTYTQSDINITKTYYLKEIADSSKKDIYNYDNTVYTVNVSIEDAGNGQLNVATEILDSKGEKTAAAFSNEYKATGSLTLTAAKTVTGRPDVPSQFEFELYKLGEQDGNPSGQPLQTVTNTGASISFDSINYETSDIGKTYYYAVKEKSGSNAAYTYSDVIYKVKAEIKHGVTAGSIQVDTTYYQSEVSDENKVESLTFNNVYGASGSISLTGKKILEGKNLEENRFSFTLYEVINKGTAYERENQIGATVTNAADGTITFPELKYTQENIGTHHYRIRETNAGNSAYTYAPSVDVTVTVAASDTNTLTVTADKNGSDTDKGIIFTNTYCASTDVVLTAKKVLNGRPLELGQFSFSLTGDGNDGNKLSQTKKNAENGIVTFDKISFTQKDIGKTYRYTLKEVIPNPEAEGYTYDKKEYSIEIAITDPDDNGQLKAAVTIDGKAYDSENPPVFTNSYEASGDITITGNKVLNGKTLTEKEFSFALKDQDEKVLQTVKNEANGQFSFHLSYNQTEVGEHTYTINEVIPEQSVKWYTYDHTVFHVTVNVTDNGDKTLNAEVTSIVAYRNGQEKTDASSITFQNDYNAKGSVTLSANKVLNGKTLAAGQFTFILTDSDGKPLQEKRNDGAGNVSFEALTYEENQLGTYVYFISEKNESADGYTYSNDVYRATVTVTDETHTGDLKTSVVYEKQIEKDGSTSYEKVKDGVPQFTNTYEAEGSIVLTGTKSLTGNKALQDQQFQFALKDANGEVIKDEDGNDMIVANEADGSFSFPALTYDADDVKDANGQVKDFVYYLSEVVPEDADSDPYDYDKKLYQITVHVQDQGNGTLSVTKDIMVKEDGEAAYKTATDIAFINHYNAKGSLELNVTKSTNIGLDKLNENTFSFKLSGSGENQIVNSDGTTGKAAFQKIKYTEKDINATYFYTITELRGRNAGYEYSNEVYLIKAMISDNGDGTLKVETEITNSMNTPVNLDQMVFVNNYRAEGSLVLDAQKILRGKALRNRQFAFILSDENGQIQRVMNDENGKVTFDAITYTQDDIGKEHTYTISEEKDQEKPLHGYTYSPEIYTVTVTVADAGNGNLVATPVITDSAGNTVTSMEFVNSYSAEGGITLTAKKAMDADLKEATLKAGEYSFSVTENGKEVASGTNDADGNVTFTEITYQTTPNDQSALGEHIYEITEKVGTDGTVIYDDTKYTVTVMVSDAGAGALDAEITGIVKGKEVVDGPGNIVFVNGVTRVEISKKILGSLSTKELPGAVLQIEDADGNVVIEPWTTGETAKYLEGVLEAGKTYYLVETAAPAGYVKAEKVSFTVSADGSIDKVEMFDDTVKVNVTKKDITNDEELPGATLQVIKQTLDADGNVTKEEVLESWISTEKAHTIETKLTTGEEYVLREITAPDGYVRATDVKFKVEETGMIQTVEMVDDITRIQISKMDITNQKELAGAHLALKDAEGKIIAEWTSDGKPKEFYGQLKAGAMYTLTEISAPVGYDLAKDITFTVEETGEIQKVVMEDEVSDGKGKITVQKLVMMDNKYTAVDYTFYAALFADEALTERVSGVRPIYVNGSYTGSTTFSDLKEGTYYVAETDESGNPIVETDVIEMNQILDGKAEITPEQSTAKSTIINHIAPLDDAYYNDGEITVDKNVLVNGEEANVDDTFYFALFVDPDMTMMADAGIKELKLEDASSGTVVFDNLPYGEYYLAEVDAEGVPVGEDFAYTVTISSYCKLDAENNSVTCKVTNSTTEEEEVEDGEEEEDTTPSDNSGSGNSGGKTSGSNNAAKTGDTTPIRTYLILLCGSVAVLFAVFGKKRKKGKHE